MRLGETLKRVKLMKIKNVLKKPQLFEVYVIIVFYTVTLSIILFSGSYNGVY